MSSGVVDLNKKKNVTSFILGIVFAGCVWGVSILTTLQPSVVYLSLCLFTLKELEGFFFNHLQLQQLHCS